MQVVATIDIDFRIKTGGGFCGPPSRAVCTSWLLPLVELAVDPLDLHPMCPVTHLRRPGTPKHFKNVVVMWPPPASCQKISWILRVLTSRTLTCGLTVCRGASSRASVREPFVSSHGLKFDVMRMRDNCFLPYLPRTSVWTDSNLAKVVSPLWYPWLPDRHWLDCSNQHTELT